MIRRFWIQAVSVHKATSCNCVLPSQLFKVSFPRQRGPNCRTSDDNHQKLTQSSSSHTPGMAKCRHEGEESRSYLNGRVRDFTGIHSIHRTKILLYSPTKIHWTQPVPSPSEVTPCVTSMIQESIPSGIRRQMVSFSPNLVSFKKDTKNCFWQHRGI